MDDLTDNRAERARREVVPGRSLRMVESRKLVRYGPQVGAFALGDAGALGSRTVRLLRELAAERDPDTSVEYSRFVAELQHEVLSAAATMLQVARDQAPSV